MKRTNKPKQLDVDAILCSDLHLTEPEKTPVCRTDDYVQVQISKLNFISDLQRKHQCPVLCAGDIFDYWKPSPWLISFALKHLPDQLIAIPGQHDLPQHNLGLIEKSGFNVLVEARKIEYLFNENAICIHYPEFDIYPVPFGNAIEEDWPLDITKINILMLHQLTWQKKPFPGADIEGNAVRLLKNNPDFDLIITGDNHQAFIHERQRNPNDDDLENWFEHSLLVNPGSILRKTADQIDFKPRIYLWNAATNTVTPEYLPIDKGVVTREHIEIKEERQNRLDSFIELLESDEIEVNFEKNVETTMRKSKVPQAIKQRVLEALENG